MSHNDSQLLGGKAAAATTATDLPERMDIHLKRISSFLGECRRFIGVKHKKRTREVMANFGPICENGHFAIFEM